MVSTSVCGTDSESSILSSYPICGIGGMVDACALEAHIERCVGSSPTSRTIIFGWIAKQVYAADWKSDDPGSTPGPTTMGEWWNR